MQVRVYWNLHRKCFSVQHKGRVVLHAEQVGLKGVTFKVNENGRQRVLSSKRKEVHAYVCGELCEIDEAVTDVELRYVSYNPYANETFVCKNMKDTPIAEAGAAFLFIDATQRPVIWA